MRLKTILAVAISSIIAISSFAQSGTIDNLSWNLDDNGTLTISGAGAMKDYKLLSSPPWSSAKESIRKVVIEEGVTTIGSYTFYKCSAMSSVSIPNTVKSIGSSAFYECTSLKSVSIPGSVTEIGKDVFFKCSGLTTLSLGESIQKIGGGLLFNCDKLEYLICSNPTPPEISTKLMNETFAAAPVTACTVLVPEGSQAAYKAAKGWKSFSKFDKISSTTPAQNNTSPAVAVATTGSNAPTSEERSGTDENISWKINDKNELYISGSGKMKRYAPDNHLRPPWYSENPNFVTNRRTEEFMICRVEKIFIAGVESIGAWAFWKCDRLTYVSIPNTVTSIEAQAFSQCAALKSIKLPDSLVNIGVNAFTGSGLSYLVIPNSVTNIEGRAFLNAALDSIVLPNRIEQIAVETFKQCDNLLAVTIPASVKNVGQEAFSHCKSLKSVTMLPSEQRQYIRKGAFAECTSLTQVNLTTSLADIEEGSFKGCSSLTSITLPNSITAIWVGVFKNSGLTSIVLPSSIRMIADSAFDGCSSLKSVTILSSKPPTIGNVFVFRNIAPDAVLYVPKGSLNSYKASGFARWFTKIVEK